jgi:DNA-binding NarL/FixJ family response regulator
MSLLIRLLIADSDVKFSRDLGRFLDKQPDIKVIGLVRDGQGVVNTCKETLPDIVLMDLHLPVLDSIRAIRAILEQNERIRIVSLSSVSNDRYAVEAIKAGASGYLNKDDETGYDTIVEAIRQVANGEVLLNPDLASSILQEFHRFSE